jgi:Protein of unknown function (DUF3074)
MFLTSDQALSDLSGGEYEVPRHFMVISRPCNHPDTQPRDGFIRGNYESVEFIREVPLKKGFRKSASTTNLPAHRNRSASTLGREAMLRNATKNHSPPITENGLTSSDKGAAAASEIELSSQKTRARGKTISYDMSKSSDAKRKSLDDPQQDDESECNPVEWIMITRSDPGGSVPRFMVERGTPGGIVADASKFLNWACAKDLEDLESDDDSAEDDDQHEKAEKHEHKPHHKQAQDLHNYQTNGHLAGIEEKPTPTDERPDPVVNHQNGGSIYEIAAGLAGVAGGYIASHTPAIIADRFPGHPTEATNGSTPRRDSVSSISSASSAGSFASALENVEGVKCDDNDGSSMKTTTSSAQSKSIAQPDKELLKLEERKRKLDEKLSKAREKEISKKNEDTAKEEEAIRRAEEKHEKEVKRQEEKYKKEVEKLEKKKEREQQKAEERKRKAIEKDEKTKLLRELEELRAEIGVLRKEKDILRSQVGDLQAENTALAAKIGKLGSQGEQVLLDVRAEVGRTGRLRASSLKGLSRTTSFRSGGSGEKEKEKEKEKENMPLAQS